MLANLVCWVIALGMMLADSTNKEDLYIKTMLAMGFILLGTISKAIDVYKEVHNNNASQTSTNMERENK